MSYWKLHNPVNIIFGFGCRSKFINNINGFKLLIISSKRGIKQISNDNFLSKILEQSSWIDNVISNPGIEETQAMINTLSGKEFDAIIAFGGGSVIDTAKAISAGLSINLENINLRNLISQPNFYLNQKLLPIYAIPTTSGTGSEVTPFATIWDHKNRKKLSLGHPNLFPRMAIVDPELTYALPYSLTISTGLDALNQAFESIWNKNRTSITNFLACESIKKALIALPRLHFNLEDFEARSMIAEASLLSGICISQTRTAICHSISYPLTAYFGISHGIACAFTMSSVARKVLDFNPDFFSEIVAHSNMNSAENLLDRLENLLNVLNIKKIVKEKLNKDYDLLELTSEMITPGRSDNFILPINKNLIKEVLIESIS